MVFSRDTVEKYKILLTDAKTKCFAFQEKVLEKMSHYETASNNEDLVKYIGYIFQYGFVKDSFSLLFDKIDLINKFLYDSSISISSKDEKTITDAAYDAQYWLPILENHDLNATPQFPTLKNLSPISTTGNVKHNEFYIAFLLRGIITKDDVIFQAIKHCIQRILDLSVKSVAFVEHYAFVLKYCEDEQGGVHTGGLAKDTRAAQNKSVLKELTQLGELYRSYILYYQNSEKYPTPEHFHMGLNSIIVDRFELDLSTYCTSSFCFEALRYLVIEYGILRKEFLTLLAHEFEEVQKESLLMLGIQKSPTSD